jgi:hypothetical protein
MREVSLASMRPDLRFLRFGDSAGWLMLSRLLSSTAASNGRSRLKDFGRKSERCKPVIIQLPAWKLCSRLNGSRSMTWPTVAPEPTARDSKKSWHAYVAINFGDS